MKKTATKPQVKQAASFKDIALRYLPLVFIIILFFIIYKKLSSFDLVDWDDYGYIKNNPDIQSLKNWKLFFTSLLMGNYHPLTTLSWAVNYYYGKLNGHTYHVTNLILHAVNIVLVFILTRKLFNRNDIPVFVAALFALHPMHVESIAWVAERKDVLYALFFLAALITYLNFLKTPGKYFNYWLTLFLFILSLLSKSAAIVLPLVLLLMDYYKNGRFNSRNLLNKIPFFVLSVLFGIIALKSQHNAMDYEFTPYFPWYSRIFIACTGMVYYIASFFYPVKMSPLHPYPVHAGEMLPLYFYLCGLVVPLILLLIFYFKKQRKLLIFGFGFFLINLLLVIQLLPVGKAVVSERYTYMPYVGLYMLSGYFLFNSKKNYKNMLLVIAGAWIILLAFTTNARIPVWNNSISLFSDIIEKYPKEESAWYNRGLAKSTNGDIKGAFDDYSSAIKLQPDYTIALYNRSLIYQQMQDYKGVLDDLNNAIRTAPGYIDAHKNRGIAYAILKNYDNSISDFNFVLKAIPNDTMTLLNRGLTYISMNKPAEACADFAKAKLEGSKNAIRYMASACNK